MELQFAARSYKSRSTPVDAQRCVNMFVENAPPDAKTRVPVFMCPGLDIFTKQGNGPVNGMHIMNGLLYTVSGGQLFSVDANGQSTSLGQTNLGGIVVAMADNEKQLVMVDGSVGWVYQPDGLNQVTTQIGLGYTATVLGAAAAQGAHAVVLASVTGFVAGDKVRIGQDDGTLFETTIGSIAGFTVNLPAPLPGPSAMGSAFYDDSQGQRSITVASTGAIPGGVAISIAMDDGTTFTTTTSGAATGPPDARVIPLTDPLPSQVSVGAVVTIPSLKLGQILAPAFQPASTVVYFDGYFVFDAKGTNQFFLSGLGDGTQYNALDFASAQANSDYLLAVVNYHEQLLLMGERSIEVWYDSGAATFPFQRFDGAYVQRGVASPYAIVQEDNTVLWLGEDRIFYRLDGFDPKRASNYGIEHAWAQYSTVGDSSAFVLTVEGHKFVFLTFYTGNATWCYDIGSGLETALWHERESWGSPWV